MKIIYVESENIMKVLCNLYCDAKSPFWRLFFGWRRTKGNKMYFKLSKKQYKRILQARYKLYGIQGQELERKEK